MSSKFVLLLIVISFVSINCIPAPLPEPHLPIILDHSQYPENPTLHRDQVAFVVAVPRVQRSPKPLVGLLHTALKSHHHHHHFRPHYGGGDHYGPSGGSFSGSGASASAFSGSQNSGHGGEGSNSHASASSNSLSFNTPFGGISASSSFAQSNSNSYGGNSW